MDEEDYRGGEQDMMNKRFFVALITLMLLSVAFVSCFPEILGAETSFSIFHITDTQFLSEYYPQHFSTLTSWIKNNLNVYNAKMTVHTGDFVNDAYSTDQWINTNNSLSTLLSNNVPYCWVAGNHDQYDWSPSGSWGGKDYATTNTNMRSKPYWVSDYGDGKNTAVQFTLNGYSFLIVNIEYLANANTISWLKNLLNVNLDKNVIVSTHSFLNNLGTYGMSQYGETNWCLNFKTLLDTYPNVFLTFAGHDNTGGASSRHRQEGTRMDTFFDRQNTVDLTQGASLQIFTFNLATSTVAVKTYLVLTDTFLTDSENQYTFTVNMKSSAPTPTPTATPTPSPKPAASLTVTNPNGGQNWVRSSYHTITWSSVVSVGDYVKIELCKGGVVNRVLASSTPNDGSWGWTISSSQTLGTDYKVRITSTSTSISDSSDSNFAVIAGTITVTAPNGGQSWRHGTTHTITWSKSGSPGSYVKIELLKGGVVNRVITSSTANDGSYSWYISSSQTPGTDYRIRITITTNSVIKDSSDSNFNIIT